MKPLKFVHPFDQTLPGMFFLVSEATVQLHARHITQPHPPAVATELATLNSGVTGRIAATAFDPVFQTIRLNPMK